MPSIKKPPTVCGRQAPLLVLSLMIYKAVNLSFGVDRLLVDISVTQPGVVCLLYAAILFFGGIALFVKNRTALNAVVGNHLMEKRPPLRGFLSDAGWTPLSGSRDGMWGLIDDSIAAQPSGKLIPGAAITAGDTRTFLPTIWIEPAGRKMKIKAFCRRSDYHKLCGAYTVSSLQVVELHPLHLLVVVEFEPAASNGGKG